MGDSAGGNLAAAITIMAITRGFRVPDGIILAYPGKNTFILFFCSLEPESRKFCAFFVISTR